MAYLKIGNTDISSYVSSLKVGTETLLSEDSGRNANGNLVIDIVNTKKKVYVGFRPLTQAEMTNLLTLINSYVITLWYKEPNGGTLTSITCYHGTPEPEYYTIQNGSVLFKAFDLNFI